MATLWTTNIVADTTSLRKSVVEELRVSIVSEKTRRGISDSVSQDTLVVGKTAGIVGHIDGIKLKIKEINNTPCSSDYIKPGLSSINKFHIDEIKTRINSLESFSNGSNVASGCSASCTGFCTSCSSCSGCTGNCTGSCSGCDSCSGSCTSCSSCAGCSGCAGACFAGCYSCSGDCTSSSVTMMPGIAYAGVDGYWVFYGGVLYWMSGGLAHGPYSY